MKWTKTDGGYVSKVGHITLNIFETYDGQLSLRATANGKTFPLIRKSFLDLETVKKRANDYITAFHPGINVLAKNPTISELRKSGDINNRVINILARYCSLHGLNGDPTIQQIHELTRHDWREIGKIRGSGLIAVQEVRDYYNSLKIN